MKKIIVSISMLVMVMSIFISTSNAKQQIPEDVYNAAKQGLDNFKTIATSNYEGYGYKKAEDIISTELGWGYQVYTINYDKLLSNEFENVRDVAEVSDKWEFMVTLDKKEMSLIYVEKDESNTYKPVGFGGNGNKFNVVYSKMFNNENCINPIIVKDMEDYYLVYNNPSSKEVVIPIVKDSTSKAIKSKQMLNNIKNRVKNYKLGERGGSLSTASSKTNNNADTNYVIAIVSISLVLALIILCMFKPWKRLFGR